MYITSVLKTSRFNNISRLNCRNFLDSRLFDHSMFSVEPKSLNSLIMFLSPCFGAIFPTLFLLYQWNTVCINYRNVMAMSIIIIFGRCANAKFAFMRGVKRTGKQQERKRVLNRIENVTRCFFCRDSSTFIKSWINLHIVLGRHDFHSMEYSFLRYSMAV